MKLKCRIISTVIASRDSEVKLPGWVSRHITRCAHCEAEAKAYTKLQNTLKTQLIEQECSLTTNDMMAALQTSSYNAPTVHHKPVLSLATACTFILVAAVGLLLTSQSGPNKPGSSKPNTEARQPLPGQQEDTTFTEAPQISLIGPDYNSSERDKDAAPPEKASIKKKEIQQAEKLVVVANNNRFTQGKRTNGQQHIPVREIKKTVPYQKHKAINTPKPEIIEQATEIDTNVATIEPDPIMIVPEDRVIEVVRDDQNVDTQCSYEIQLVNTDDSSNYAVPL